MRKSLPYLCLLSAIFCHSEAFGEARNVEIVRHPSLLMLGDFSQAVSYSYGYAGNSSEGSSSSSSAMKESYSVSTVGAILDPDVVTLLMYAGISYQHVREVLPEASVLKLGLVHPLPFDLIRQFAAKVEKLYVVEELDPFIEEQVKAMGIKVLGKKLIPRCGELTPGRLESALHGRRTESDYKHSETLPGRPPNMCAGCSHRSVFYSLKRLGAFVTGDIGCYTLGFLPPLSAMDTCVCMGAGISNATGLIKALPPQERYKVVGVMGDSTFLHTGINSLIDMAYNGGLGTVVLLDNRVTAMTGRQENPGSGYTLSGVESPPIDLQALCRVLGVKHVEVIDPYDLTRTEQVLRQEMERPELSVVIARRPCMLDRRHGPEPTPALTVVEEHCRGCKLCLKLGCPAISWQKDDQGPTKAHIDSPLCSGCGVCRQLCKFEAIEVCDER